jgi:NAD(P)H dehydrogenase (quinone)
MKTIGITGATGQLGQLVVEKLKEKTSNLVALVRSLEKAKDIGIASRVFDYNSADASALAGIDTLIFISASEIGKRVAHHEKVIAAAKDAGVGHIIYTSLLHADHTTVGLAGEHLATEKMIEASGIPSTVLRNGWYIENYTGTLQAIIAHGTHYGASGSGKISAASRVDFAEALAAVAASEGHEGKVYELAGDEAFTGAEFAAALSKVGGKEITFVNMDEQSYADVLKQVGLPEHFAQFLASADTSITNGDLYDDGHDLSKLIGRPTTSLSAVLTKALA